MNKATVDEIMLSIEPMGAEQKKQLGFPPQIFIPVIKCADGIIIPVKDITAKSTGTFAVLDETGDLFIMKPGGAR